jgi:photosystem II stability/assembly factor-like uncharacterized protein
MVRSLKFSLVVPAVLFAVACGKSEPPRQAPQFSSEAVLSAVEGTPYVYTVAVTGEPAPTLTATAPAWLSLQGNLLGGTPAAGDVGEHEVVLTATNGVEPAAVQTFTVTVVAVGAAPAFSTTPVTAATEGQQYSYAVAATGDPAPSISATQLPSWLTFEGNVLVGVPGYDNGGAHQVLLTASNGISPDATQAFTITVATVSAPPAFTSTPVTTATEGQTYSYPVTLSGTPTPTVTATQLPSWLTFTGGILSGTPTYANAGAHQVVLTASNGISPDATHAFTITVATVSVPPAFTSTPVTTATEGSAYSYTVTASGTPTPTLTASGASGAALPAWLSFNAATGVLSGTPAAADAGNAAIVITAQNGIPPAATQSFTIQVAALPVAPTITSTPVTSAVEGQAYSYTVTATGQPAPALTAALSGAAPLPAWLTFDGTTGVLSGTPGAADVGQLSLEILAANGTQPDDTQTFTLTVASAAVAITSTAPTAAQVGTPYTYTVTTSGSPAPSVSVTGLPAWLTFNGTDTLSGTPTAAGTTGTITVTASNGISTSATETFAITIAPLPPIAVAGAPYFQDFGTSVPLGWTAAAPWQFGTPTTGGSSVGPPSVLDGPLAATNLTGNYPAGMNAGLQTPNFDLTGVAAPRLRFAHWYNFEASSTLTSRYDGGNIKISTDGGQTWTQLAPGSVTPAYTGTITATSNPMSGQLVWTGILSNWESVEVDLAANLGGQPLTQVALRFDASSDGFVNRPGWYLDAVRVGDASQLPQAPIITSPPPASLTVVAGNTFSHTVTATGSPTPVLSASGAQGAALPAWLTFNPSTGVLSGTPTTADAGSHPVELTASNGEPPSAIQSFTLTVVLPPPANDTCASPQLVAFTGNTSTFNADTTYATDSTSACVTTASSRELVYEIQTAGVNDLVISATGASGVNPALYLRSTSCTSGTQVACVNATGNGGTETITAAQLPAGSYFLFVETVGAASGVVNVTVNLSPVDPSIVPPTMDSIIPALTSNTTPTFTWTSAPGTVSTTFELATDPAFLNIVASKVDTTDGFFVPTTGLTSGRYFYRGRSKNSSGSQSPNSEVKIVEVQTWHFVSPRPQPNNLNGVSCSTASDCILTGNNGTVILTADQGNTFQLGSSGVTTSLYQTARVSSNVFVTVGASGRILRSTDGGHTWWPMASGVTVTLYDVAFEGQVGYAAGTSGTLLRSADGGTTWTKLTIPTTNDLWAVATPAPGVAIAAGNNGVMVRTSDGGQSWATVNSGLTNFIRSMRFRDASNGYAVTSGGQMARTTDAGATWTTMTSGTASSLYSVSFADAMNGVVVAPLAPSVRYTTDGGATWQVSTRAPTAAPSWATLIPGTTKGVMVTDGGGILVTNDSGATWTFPAGAGLFQPSTAATDGNIRTASFVSPTEGFVFGSGNFAAVTTNGGQSFTPIDVDPSVTTEVVNTASFTSTTHGWVGGSNSLLRRTLDGGLTFTAFNTASTPATVNGIHFLSPAVGVAVGTSSRIVRWDDATQAFVIEPLLTSAGAAASSRTLNGVSLVSATAGFIAGASGTVAVYDPATASWVLEDSGNTSSTLNGVAAIDASTAVAVGTSGRIVRRSGSSTWAVIPSGTTSTLNAVAFADANNGWAVGASGVILRTSDGGLTWVGQSSPAAFTLLGLSAVTANDAFIVAGSRTILKTTAGGR